MSTEGAHPKLLPGYLGCHVAAAWGVSMQLEKYHGLGNDYLVLDAQNNNELLYERGAGYTLASGTSSCAAATAAYRLGLVDSTVLVLICQAEN